MKHIRTWTSCNGPACPLRAVATAAQEADPRVDPRSPTAAGPRYRQTEGASHSLSGRRRNNGNVKASALSQQYYFKVRDLGCNIKARASDREQFTCPTLQIKQGRKQECACEHPDDTLACIPYAWTNHPTAKRAQRTGLAFCARRVYWSLPAWTL